ncbi:precorrin-8X methylmutase [Methylomonas sp. 11b]|uniref:precorrin-8X methylmutase n=1 Tax=Methylomonas sp. 11b TaxID=1168169 RepID=UPI0004787FC1|nr:precorrin-8X methylmutase [Methylomonas sp. 11b]
MSHNIQTEQLTQAGQQIEHDSFAIVDREVGEHHYSHGQWQVVRRMIHATADFEFNGLTEFSAHAVEDGIQAILNGAPIVADVEMICVGLSQPRLAHFGISARQFIADADVIAAAKQVNSTRAVQAMRKAQRLGLIAGGIVSVGNAPTALLEVLRMIKEEGVKPALIVGMPVGFVSAAESKDLLAELADVPWIITRGRKGGSTLVVAAIHALLSLTETRQKNG